MACHSPHHPQRPPLDRSHVCGHQPGHRATLRMPSYLPVTVNDTGKHSRVHPALTHCVWAATNTATAAASPHSGASGRPRLAHCGYILGTSWRFQSSRVLVLSPILLCRLCEVCKKLFLVVRRLRGTTGMREDFREYRLIIERRKLYSRRAGQILQFFGGLVFGCCMYATVSLLFHHSAGLLVLRLVLAQFIGTDKALILMQ